MWKPLTTTILILILGFFSLGMKSVALNNMASKLTYKPTSSAIGLVKTIETRGEYLYIEIIEGDGSISVYELNHTSHIFDNHNTEMPMAHIKRGDTITIYLGE